MTPLESPIDPGKSYQFEAVVEVCTRDNLDLVFEWSIIEPDDTEIMDQAIISDDDLSVIIPECAF